MISSYTYRPRIYYTLTFLTTFALWFAGAYVSFHDGGRGLHMLLLLPGLMAPFLISLGMILGADTPALKQDFFNRLLNPRLIRPGTLPFMFVSMPLTVVTAILLSLPFGGSLKQLQLAEGFSFSTGFVPVLLLLLLAATFEELGWRGYAFDSLQSRYRYVTASLLFGVAWSLWHLPLIFVKDSYQYQIMQENVWFGINFFVGIIPLGVIISWVCLKNRKSVLAAVLFHFIINMSQEGLEITQMTKGLQTLVLIVLAAAIIIWDKKLFFAKPQPVREVRA